MHKLLERQIKKRFGSVGAVPDALKDFLEVVSQAYEQADDDRSLVERSLDLTSAELLSANAALREDREVLELRVRERNAELLAANQILERETAERCNIEAALSVSEERYQRLAEFSPVGIFQTDSEGECIYVNQAARVLAGLTPEELYGSGWLQFLHPDEREVTARDWRQSVEAGRRIQALELRLRRPDGSIVWLALSATPIRDQEGRISGYVGTVSDITERKLIEETIRRSEEKYRDIFEGSRDPLYISTVDGDLVDINPAGVQLFGFESKEELGTQALKDLYADPSERDRLLQQLETDGYVQDYELELKRKDGTVINVLASVTAVGDAHGEINAMRGTLHDVTEWRKLQAQLQQAQKLEAIGRLAGGVAHDFNNLLTAILGYSDLLLMSVPPDEEARQHVEEIRAAGKRGADLTKQLLVFSRRQVVTPQLLQLNETIEKTEKLIRRIIGEDIKFVTDLHDLKKSVRADPTQIEQVVLNLCINARDAMPDGGTLEISTRALELTKNSRRRHLGVAPGSYALLEVVDTGIGMDEAVREQIFEPFFTTKPAGKGTGLGLATVYGIVQSCSGYVEVNTSPGRGTAFRVYLPMVLETAGAADEPSPGDASPTGSEVVLLVEDEEAVRNLLSGVLRRQGYRVHVAAAPDEAVEIFEEVGHEVDIVVSDVVMPQMSGVELTARLRGICRHLPVLYISGYTDQTDILLRSENLERNTGFLQKPFTTDTFARKLRGVLDRAKADAAARISPAA